MSGQATFCTKCGNPLEPGARFCMKCGAARAVVAPASTPAAARTGSAGPSIAANPMQVARRAAGAAGTVGAMAGAVSLPWQTIIAGESPDVRKLIAAGAPIAQQAVRVSLRRPAIALLVTTLLEVVVALVTQQPGALKLIGLRAAMGIGTAVLGMVVGSKGGPLRRVTGIASVVTGLVQTGSMVFMLVSAPFSATRMIGVLPNLISQASALVMLVKTSIVSLKKPSAGRATSGRAAEQPSGV